MKQYVYKALVITELLIATLFAVSCNTGKKFNYGNLANYQMSCTICGRTNHFTSECRACHKCRKVGHQAKDCTYIECNNCHKPGHLAKDCTNVDCRKCGKNGHKATNCTYIECNYCHKPGHQGKDCTQKLQCRNCNKFGHLKKDCLFCKNCLKVGHHKSECYSCYVCGKDHKTFSCRPKKPNKPQVWVDSETGSIFRRQNRIYKAIYPKLVEAYNRKIARRKDYFVKLRELGITTKKNFQYDDDTYINVKKDLLDYSEQYKVERKNETDMRKLADEERDAESDYYSRQNGGVGFYGDKDDEEAFKERVDYENCLRREEYALNERAYYEDHLRKEEEKKMEEFYEYYDDM